MPSSSRCCCPRLPRCASVPACHLHATSSSPCTEALAGLRIGGSLVPTMPTAPTLAPGLRFKGALIGTMPTAPTLVTPLAGAVWAAHRVGQPPGAPRPRAAPGAAGALVRGGEPCTAGALRFMGGGSGGRGLLNHACLFGVQGSATSIYCVS